MISLKNMLKRAGLGVILLQAGLPTTPGQCGVFNLPHFVTPGEFAIGVEPELVTTGTAALGINIKYTHGVNDLSNFTGILGTGGGSRLFRVGGNYTFDFFPDTGNQPGIGLALQGLFVQLPNTGSLETTAIPYIHKSFKTDQGPIEPFLAIPVGLSLAQGTYQSLSSVVLGGLFQHSEHLRSVFEFGISISNASTYISGGLVYYH